ncbi:MAG: IS607 family transposase, partial [Promethearchaeota archaeon]
LEGLKEFMQTGVYTQEIKHTTEKAAIYARVSSQKQKADLKRQIDFLLSVAEKDGWKKIEVYKDIGSGLNDERKGLRNIVRDAVKHKFDKVYINYKDRLARFGTQIILDIFDLSGIECQIVRGNSGQEKAGAQNKKSFEQELVANILAILTSFSGKLYRSRRGKNKSKNEKNKNEKTKNEKTKNEKTKNEKFVFPKSNYIWALGGKLASFVFDIDKKEGLIEIEHNFRLFADIGSDVIILC